MRLLFTPVHVQVLMGVGRIREEIKIHGNCDYEGLANAKFMDFEC